MTEDERVDPGGIGWVVEAVSALLSTDSFHDSVTK